MGRTDEAQFFLELIAEWRRLGARVTVEPGAETRGNGTQGNYEGASVHHTASVTSLAKPNPTRSLLIDGRSDLSGPLCNVTGPACAENDPWLHVIAFYPANHAGASGGSSMGPMPVTSLFNPRTVGLEIDYAGSTPMLPGQYKAALIFARGIANVLERSTEYIRAHAETSITGKWDPGYAPGKTIDMAAFRRDAAAYTATAPGGLSVADINSIQAGLDAILTELRGPNLAGWPTTRFGVAAQPKLTLVDYLRNIDRELNSLLAVGGRPVPAEKADTTFGQVLSTRALAEQILVQAKVAATRVIEVDASKIDMSKVAVAAPASGTVQLSDAQMNRLADLVADRLATRLAS
jgi:hypothetical protein